MMFETLQLRLFYLEKSSVRKGYFNVFATFSEQFWLKSGKICKNNHCVFVIALTLVLSFRRCCNTRPRSLVFKQLPRTQQKLMHHKTCVIPICLIYYALGQSQNQNYVSE